MGLAPEGGHINVASIFNTTKNIPFMAAEDSNFLA